MIANQVLENVAGILAVPGPPIDSLCIQVFSAQLLCYRIAISIG